MKLHVDIRKFYQISDKWFTYKCRQILLKQYKKLEFKVFFGQPNFTLNERFEARNPTCSRD